MVNNFKICNKCKINKPKSSFPVRSRTKCGVAPYCKECTNKSSRSRYSAEESRNRHYKRKYGIDRAIYDYMVKQQNGLCPICKRHESELKKILCVDHCHASGKVRGLICYDCNIMLGFSRDNVAILQSAIEYLKTNG